VALVIRTASVTVAVFLLAGTSLVLVTVTDDGGAAANGTRAT